MLLFCVSQVIIICIKFDCLNRSGLIGTNTQKCALPVISDSLANAFCKIALDFNNRLLVLEHRAILLQIVKEAPSLWPLQPPFTGALGSKSWLGSWCLWEEGLSVVPGSSPLNNPCPHSLRMHPHASCWQTGAAPSLPLPSTPLALDFTCSLLACSPLSPSSLTLSPVTVALCL